MARYVFGIKRSTVSKGLQQHQRSTSSAPTLRSFLNNTEQHGLGTNVFANNELDQEHER